jgi:hypothetical protein
MQSIRECSVDNCFRRAKSRGWCGTHHERWRRNGSLELLPTPSLEERFWMKVNARGVCWEWTGAMSDTGYGWFFMGRPEGGTGAHRAAWRLLIGDIPDGLVLDHLCRNRKCVNPAHMEPVTEMVNIRRGASPMVMASLANICMRGHSLADAYLAHRADGRVTRRCRTCHIERASRSPKKVGVIR